MKKFSILMLLGFMCSPVVAQEMLELSDQEIQRLGISFSPLQEADHRVGETVSALLINSPERIGELNAIYDGIVEDWLVGSGDQVAPGSLIARLRSTSVVEVQQDFLDAAAELSRFQFEKDKDLRLLEAGVISRQRMQQTELAWNKANAHYQAARQVLRSAGFSSVDIEQLQADPSQMGTYPFRSPVSAIITRRTVPAGHMVMAGEPLVQLSSGDTLWVSARIPAHYLGVLRVGQTLSVSQSSATLTLRQLDSAVDNRRQTVLLLAEFDDPSGLVQGQVVSLVLPATEENALLVPAAAVVHNGEQRTVYVRVAGGVEARQVELNPSGSFYLAISGLEPGEEVVTNGAVILKGMQLGLGGE